MSQLRHSIIVSALAVAGASATSMAQVGLRVNWTAPGGVPKTCVITSDTDGVFMDAGGSLVLNGNFGTGCPSGETTPPLPPVILNGLDATELPPSSAIGAVHTVSWSADADSCSYSASTFPAAVPGWPTSGDICTTAASCATTQSAAVLLPVAGSYTFALTCRRNGVATPVTSQRTVVVPAIPTAGCIAPIGLTRLEQAYVEFNYTVNNGIDQDARHFANIYGYFDDVTPLKPYPGVINLNRRPFIPPGYYIAMQFTVPSNLAIGTAGRYRFEETQPQALTMSYTLSKSCGDFRVTPQAPLSPFCTTNGGAPGAALVWIVGASVPGLCRLERGETYYLNLVHATLETPLISTCPNANHCGNTLQNAVEAGSPPWP